MNDIFRKYYKEVVIMVLAISLVISLRVCGRYKQLIRDTDIRTREYTERLDSAVGTISAVRTAVGDIRSQLEGSTGRLQDVIDTLREIAKAVEDLENNLDRFYFDGGYNSNTADMYGNTVSE